MFQIQRVLVLGGKKDSAVQFEGSSS